MSERDIVFNALYEHQMTSTLRDSCTCGAGDMDTLQPTGVAIQRHRRHVALVIEDRLAEKRRDDEALIHARWHRVLDDPSSDEGPIGTHVRQVIARAQADDALLRQAAAWVAESIGYPVQVTMPDHLMPQALWDALVDYVHADESGNWHGNTLDREEVEAWLADEAGRDLNDPTAPAHRHDRETATEEADRA